MSHMPRILPAVHFPDKILLFHRFFPKEIQGAMIHKAIPLMHLLNEDFRADRNLAGANGLTAKCRDIWLAPIQVIILACFSKKSLH